MTITLDLPPEVEANLSAQAKARELSLHAFLKSLIEERARVAGSAPERRQLSPEDWGKGLEDLLDCPTVPEGVREEAFHRIDRRIGRCSQLLSASLPCRPR